MKIEKSPLRLIYEIEEEITDDNDEEKINK